MDRDRVEGAARSTAGKMKEAAGKALGDEKMKKEGQVEKIAGKVQNAVGGIKDSMREERDRKP